MMRLRGNEPRLEQHVWVRMFRVRQERDGDGGGFMGSAEYALAARQTQPRTVKIRIAGHGSAIVFHGALTGMSRSGCG
ncbi:MAG: hypothetical protein RLP45_14700, partial [Haliea sp.]